MAGREGGRFLQPLGQPALGVRLKDGGSAIGGVPIARVKERNFEYLVYRMPFGGMTGLLGATPGELAKLFRRYGVPILVNKVDVDVGEEERI